METKFQANKSFWVLELTKIYTFLYNNFSLNFEINLNHVSSMETKFHRINYFTLQKLITKL